MNHISYYNHIVVRKIFNQKHPYLAEIMFKWDKIVGYDYSNLTNPVDIKKIKVKGSFLNILYVQVPNSSVYMEISYRQDIILERLKIYFGCDQFTIHKLRIVNVNSLVHFKTC